MCIGLINWMSVIVLFAVNFCLVAKIILRFFLVFIILRFDKLSKMNITIIFLLSVCDASVIYVNLQVNAWCFLFSDLHCDSFCDSSTLCCQKFPIRIDSNANAQKSYYKSKVLHMLCCVRLKVEFTSEKVICWHSAVHGLGWQSGP